MSLLDLHFKESLHDFRELDAYLNKQQVLEAAAEAREELIQVQVSDSTSEYYFLKPENILEAITESDITFQNKLGAAMQKNDAQAVLRIIADESKTYWFQYLRAIN